MSVWQPNDTLASWAARNNVPAEEVAEIPAWLQTLLADQYAPLASPTFTGTVTVPAATGAGQAVQVTAKDPATGRLAIGGMEMGDTGQRTMTASQLNGWSMAYVGLRRIGNVVYLFSGWGAGPGSAATSATFLSIPSGFAPNYATRGRAASSDDTVVLFVSASVANFVGTYPTVSGGINMSWTTVDPWPTSLPGTQATPPLA